ncbi:MAG: hypothetical protein ACM3ZV_14565 [Bacillota bacterium]
MFLLLGGFIAICVLSSYLTTTPEQRAEQRAKFARWNPLFIAIIILCLGVVLYPWPPPSP